MQNAFWIFNDIYIYKIYKKYGNFRLLPDFTNVAPE